MTEIKKYQGIYATPGSYGHSNHGANSVSIFEKWSFASLLDVGCGHNEFVASIRQRFPNVRAVGADFACPSADVKADANALPFIDGSFDLLTAFDVLEHLLPEQVDATMAGFARISKAFVFSISYVPSVNKWQGETLHPTVQPESWWMERIAAAGGIVKKSGRYLYGRWSNAPDITAVPPFIASTAKTLLIGNGPSVLQTRRGFAIDSFDEVVRFNDFKTQGFEEFTGTRTTVWATNGACSGPQDAGFKSKRTVCTHRKRTPVDDEQVWNVPPAYLNALKAKLVAASNRDEEGKKRIMASCGLVAAVWLLDEQINHLTLLGFDHFRKEASKQHHYWNPKTFGQPKEHDGEAEALVLQPYVEAGRIVYLA